MLERLEKSLWEEPEFDRPFAFFEEFRRRLDRLFDEVDLGFGRPMFHERATRWPRAYLRDEGVELVLNAEVPGVSAKDLQITADENALTIAGERHVEKPEGYSARKEERPAMRFSRSFEFPCTVDLEKSSASLKDGVLTVRVAKAVEAQPRQIPVKTAA
ncbi:MAG: Hsp20/alpha crystallin family protein [Deltaproteobacteria bacterium]|nr:Hsp20/alpha crystallin family protein [Deltaproteobacteria bacterium]